MDENFNKALSFILGLVVVVVFVAVLTGKINLKKPSFLVGKTTQPSITPTPTSPKLSPTVTPTPYTHIEVEAKSIPSTGSPTILLPAIFSALSAGLYLRKKS